MEFLFGSPDLKNQQRFYFLLNVISLSVCNVLHCEPTKLDTKKTLIKQYSSYLNERPNENDRETEKKHHFQFSHSYTLEQRR